MSNLTTELIVGMLHKAIPNAGNSCLEIDFVKLANSFLIAMKLNLQSLNADKSHLSFEISDGDNFFTVEVNYTEKRGYALSVQQTYKETIS